MKCFRVIEDCSDPQTRPDPVGESESKPGDARPKPFIEYILFSNLCGSDFNLGQAHKHLQIQKYRYYKGISSPFQNDLQNRYLDFKLFLQNINIQKKTWSECMCRSVLRNSFSMTRRSSILRLLSITAYHSVPGHW